MRKRLLSRWTTVMVLTALAGLIVAGCGSSTSSSTGNTADRAFLNDMIPHHQSAIEMARMAQKQAEHPEIKNLAGSIIADQQSEIALMAKLGSQIKGGDAKSTLGMNMHAMGMDMNMGALMNARPFDRAFIDDMVPHHRGAVEMAKMELAQGKSPQARALAQRIIDSQSKEIGEMNQWRTRWYGGPVPAMSPGMDMHSSH